MCLKLLNASDWNGELDLTPTMFWCRNGPSLVVTSVSGYQSELESLMTHVHGQVNRANSDGWAYKSSAFLDSQVMKLSNFQALRTISQNST